MDGCTEQMLEMEQADEVYRVGRALRGIFPPGVPSDVSGDPHVLLAQVDRAAAERDDAGGPPA